MSDGWRLIGRVEDMDGWAFDVAVDHDTVAIGRYRLTQAQAEEFARLFISAVWQAGQQAGYGRGRDDEAAGLPVSGMGDG
jgi:hypothetical protein